MLNLKVVLGILIVILVIVVGLVIVTVNVSRDSNSSTSQSAAARIGAAVATPMPATTVAPVATFLPLTTSNSTSPSATSLPISISTPLPTPTSLLTPTCTPLSTATSLPTSVSNRASLPAATLSPDQVAVGQAYPKVYNKLGTDIKVVKVADAPLISQDMAFQILTKQLGGVPFGYGSSGVTVTLDTTYGLVTEGYCAPNGIWAGLSHIHLSDGEVLDHLENRLMWVLDFGGIYIPGSMPNCGCYLNHAVYLIDAKTETVTIGDNFYAP